MEEKKEKKNNTYGSQEKKQNPDNIFSTFGKCIDNTIKELKYTLPNTDSVVKLFGKKEDLKEMIKQNNFIDKNNFRLQIGKMQEDGNTIYSPLMLSFGIDYIIDHIKPDKNGESKVIIQLWPDLAQSLLQNDDNEGCDEEGKKILSFEREKSEIEKLIRKKFKKKLKKKFGKKRKDVIEIQNVANNYSDVFSAIKDNGKEGIIPKKEPKLEAPLKSPLPIIEYLAYHCVNDEKDKNGASKLMNLFYETKPSKYIGNDVKNKVNPGESDADYYSVVEVGIRLYEILNGISIQGGIGRQRVYDKIISLILFGEDRIGTSKDYGIKDALNLENYLSLSKLHDWINEKYKDIKMQQLYIDLNEKSLNKIENNVERKENRKSKIIRRLTGLALLGTLTYQGINAFNITREQSQRDKEEEKRIELWDKYSRGKPDKNTDYGLSDYLCSVIEEESIILETAYDISEYDYYKVHYRDLSNEIGYTSNKIVDDFRSTFYPCYQMNNEILTAPEYINYFCGRLINQFGFHYQKPYEHLKTRKQKAISNTLKYGEKIDLSKAITMPSNEKKVYKYFNIGESGGHHYSYYPYDYVYILKFIKVLINGKFEEVVLAAKYDYFNGEPQGEFTIENGLKCMRDLQKEYGFEE